MHRSFSGQVTTFALALLVGCAGGRPPETAAERRGAAPEDRAATTADREVGPERAAERDVRPDGAAAAEDPGLDRGLARALDRSLETGGWDELHVVTECFVRDAFLQAELFGDGVGIWNGERQFAVGRDELLSLLERFRRAGFPAFQELYGKGETPDAGPPGSAPATPVQGAEPSASGSNPARAAMTSGSPPAVATRVICRVALTLDGATHQSVQVAEGRRFPALQELAEEVLGAVRAAGEAGVGAVDLADGLEKVADSRLAPRAFRLLLHRKPEAEAIAAGEPAFLLRLEGRELSVQSYRPGAGYGEAAVRELAPEELSALAKLLADSRAGELPVNLWAEHYTDLVVEVLDREARVQARRFAGMTPITHPEAQPRFDRIYQALAQLARTALGSTSVETSMRPSPSIPLPGERDAPSLPPLHGGVEVGVGCAVRTAR